MRISQNVIVITLASMLCAHLQLIYARSPTFPLLLFCFVFSHRMVHGEKAKACNMYRMGFYKAHVHRKDDSIFLNAEVLYYLDEFLNSKLGKRQSFPITNYYLMRKKITIYNEPAKLLNCF